METTGVGSSDTLLRFIRLAQEARARNQGLGAVNLSQRTAVSMPVSARTGYGKASAPVNSGVAAASAASKRLSSKTIGSLFDAYA